MGYNDNDPFGGFFDGLRGIFDHVGTKFPTPITDKGLQKIIEDNRARMKAKQLKQSKIDWKNFR